MPRRGEIWYVYTPGQPDDPHQPRPALVISEDVRNAMRDDLIVIPVFSRGRLGPTRVALPAGAGGLGSDSVLFCEEITTIDRDFLADGPLGRPLGWRQLDQVVRAIRRAVGEVVSEP
ncbi:MAG: type II toxin-antitoxin system PemK/MazF family toxin [Candidatus Dormibacteraeota bacterium]|uniref:Type II toxin-antitoxin system PemK/MazF family toxin n=1 Tax=Candidatus Amunia macphersoniae TaxID=3127014 RepID=A0A934KLR2_9BACT|nr:type II toxin-antitoxin system PemK/MazF family toxin [Candidatus Dormibacteraeota bacterium]